MMRIWLAIALTAAAPTLQAKDVPTDYPRTAEEVERVFEAIDRDGDDRISRSEGQRTNILRERFDGVDANEDGYVSRSEYRARPRNESFE